MATDTRNLPAFLSGDADFRTWGSGIAAQIAAMGLVQTSDTGQINWTTVTRPAAINTSAGYEMWRFNDALQATKPVFIRFDYGVGSAVDRPRIIPRVSTATDGAGVQSGQLGIASVTVTQASSKSAGVLLPSFCSGSTSRLNLFTGVDLTGAASLWGGMIWVERSKTNLGVDTGDGIGTWFCSANGVSFQVIPFSGTVPTAAASNPAISLVNGAVSSVGANVAFSPTVLALGKGLFASWAAYISADLPKLALVSVDHLGAVRTLLPLGDTALVSGTVNFVQGTVTGHSFAMLWE